VTTAEAAIAEIRIVAAVLARLDRPATIGDIAEAGGLDRKLVVRRLRSSSSIHRAGYPTYFTHDAITKLWKLTADGRNLLEAK
jgi:hypothetical protein